MPPWRCGSAFVAAAVFYLAQLQAAAKTAAAVDGRIHDLQTIDSRIGGLAKTNDELTTRYNHASRIIAQRDAWAQLLAT